MKKIRLTLFLTVFVCLTGASVHAAEVSVVINKEQTKVDISSIIGDEEGVITTVAVYDEENSNLSNPDLFYAVQTKASGKVETDFLIPETFESGVYNVMLANENGSGKGTFRYVTEAGIEYVMGIMNQKESAVDIASVIETEYINLAIPEDLEEDIITDCANYFFNLYPANGYTDTKLFMKNFNSCLAGSFIKNGYGVFKTLEEYGEKIGIDFAYYTAIPDEIKPVFEECVRDADFNADYLYNQLKQLKVLAYFKESKTWDKAKYGILGIDQSGKKINDNFEILNPETEYYDSIVNKNDFFTDLFNSKDTINSFSVLRSKFESLAFDRYLEENKKSPAGSKPGRDPAPSDRVTISQNAVNPVKPQENKVFNDVSGHWAEKNILKMHDMKIISGYPDGEFKPDNNITRAEFVKLVCGVFNLDASSGNISFTDVNTGDWYFNYVKSAVSQNIVYGVSENEFAPNDNITRQDACVILYRCLENSAQFESEENLFTDHNEISEYAKAAVSAMKIKGIINGYDDGAFYPRNLLTRAQAATLFATVMNYSDNS